MLKIFEIRNDYKEKLKFVYDEREITSLLTIVFEEVMGLSRAKVALIKNKELEKEDENRMLYILKELEKQKPIQYILSFADFYGLRIFVNQNVLIPRQETEELVDLIIRENRQEKDIKILDVGTGSGCIAVCLKKNISKAQFIAIDISEKALTVAKKNAEKHQANIQFKKMNFLNEKNWEKLDDFDIIVSNPPYVRQKERQFIKKNVLEFEPATALFVSNEDPLIFYKKLEKFCIRKLKHGGKVYLEINEDFGNEVLKTFSNSFFTKAKIIKDLNGKERILSAEKI